LVIALQVIDSVKKTHPSLPIILYISGSGGLLERMAAANPDIISIDQSVDIVDGIKRVGSGFAIQVRQHVMLCSCWGFLPCVSAAGTKTERNGAWL
jgi:hypothetical protein